MRFSFPALRTPEVLEAAARAFEEDGYLILEDLGTTLSGHFRPIVADRLGVGPAEMEQILEPEGAAMVLPEETRARLSRIDTPPELAGTLVELLSPLLERFNGPFVQVSSNFHGQFKGGDHTATAYGGYDQAGKYLEVHRPYLIHQDFTGGSLPTSPAGLTLWTPLNSCPDWTLRLWPGSHRHGMLCKRFPALDDPKLAGFRPHVDIPARQGTAALFNALVLHATSNPGSRRRLSCDIRFFPLTAFVPSEPRIIGARPLHAIHAALERDDGPTLQAARREALAFMGQGRIGTVPPRSILNWGNYITALLGEGPEAALAHLVRFVNNEAGWDEPEAYLPTLHDRPVHAATLRSVREQLARLEPDAGGLERLEQLAGMSAA